MMDANLPSRRPISARQTHWAHALAAWLVRRGLRPNQVSVLSAVFAALAGLCLVVGAHGSLALQIALFAAAAGFIQLRLLCNLMDGMMAVEGGLGTKTGPIFNELPDRFSDAVILICAGYAVTGTAWGATIGWAAALLAVLTAYVRAFAGSLGATQDFGGPMAKQQRIEVVSASCLLGAAVAAAPGWSDGVMLVALGIIAAGSTITIVRRTMHLVVELKSK